LVKRLSASDASADDAQSRSYLEILRDNLTGSLAARQGDAEGAVMHVQRAATRLEGMAFDFGPPPSVKPPHELLGELLLAQERAAEASEAFRASLKLAPRRVQSLRGLARAQVAQGHRKEAAATYADLIAIWQSADSGLEGLAEARRFVDAQTALPKPETP
jgi:cytochrome c-type biogenesis protein CcmH/NrfG